jgi:hypothetical protein
MHMLHDFGMIPAAYIAVLIISSGCGGGASKIKSYDMHV